MSVKWKIFFRSKGSRGWSTHVGFYDDLEAKDREVIRLSKAFHEIKLRTITTDDIILK